MRGNPDSGDVIMRFPGKRNLITGFDRKEEPFVTDQYAGSDYNPAILDLIAEGGRIFFRYLESLGLTNESNLLVLSSKHHFYYDENDLRNVRTVVCLKKLNSIRYLEPFLFTLIRILPADASFVGCFSDVRASNPDRYHFSWFRVLNGRLRNFLDSRTEHLLDEKKVAGLLGKNGLKIASAARINGITYFCSKRILLKRYDKSA